MFDKYVIEIRPNAVGITVQAGVVVRDGRGFRFFAATNAFNRLEGQLFANPKAAEQAALWEMASRARNTTSTKPSHLPASAPHAAGYGP